MDKRGPILLALLAASSCATDTFHISASAQERAEAEQNLVQMGLPYSEDLGGFGLNLEYDRAVCRWSDTEPGVAACNTRGRVRGREWEPMVKRYVREAQGGWKVAPGP